MDKLISIRAELSAALQRAEKAEAENISLRKDKESLREALINESKFRQDTERQRSQLESVIDRYRAAEKALPEEPEYCDADGYILQSNNQKPVFVKKAAYDALRAHAAALQAERDAMRGEIYALRKYGNKDCTAMADAALAELRSAAIDVARGKK